MQVFTSDDNKLNNYGIHLGREHTQWRHICGHNHQLTINIYTAFKRALLQQAVKAICIPSIIGRRTDLFRRSAMDKLSSPLKTCVHQNIVDPSGTDGGQRGIMR